MLSDRTLKFGKLSEVYKQIIVSESLSQYVGK